jgi:uncharacterized protein YidB (DUF937 family)
VNLLNDVVGKLTGGTGTGETTPGLAASALDLLCNRQGGVAGLLQSFQQNGLGHIVSSWIGTGENMPVSSEQIQQVLGNEQVRAFAEKAGIAPEAASSQLAEVLPGIVDKLTPNGEVPQGGDLMSTGMTLLQGLFSGRKGTP